MDEKKVLEELGLSNGEIKVYLALLKLGSSPVSELKKETNMHRTTIYDFIEKLLQKGLVNYVKKGNINYYKATDPKKLMEFLKEKERKLKEVLPKLDALANFQKEQLKVEIYEGKEGYKTLLELAIKHAKELMIMGVEEETYEEKVPYEMRYYFKRAKQKNIKEKILVRKNTPRVYENKLLSYRAIPEEFFTPTPTYVFGNYVCIQIWQPLTILIIESKELSIAYKNYFNLLWNMAVPIEKANPCVEKIKV